MINVRTPEGTELDFPTVERIEVRPDGGWDFCNADGTTILTTMPSGSRIYIGDSCIIVRRKAGRSASNATKNRITLPIVVVESRR